MFEFEWNDQKAEGNFRKHSIRFSEAATVWFDADALEMLDLEHSVNEERWIRIGISRLANVLVVVYGKESENYFSS